jgi:hypothetical protein
MESLFMYISVFAIHYMTVYGLANAVIRPTFAYWMPGSESREVYLFAAQLSLSSEVRDALSNAERLPYQSSYVTIPAVRRFH